MANGVTIPDRILGPALMAVAMTMFAINDAALKWLSNMEQLPLFQVLGIRSAVIAALMLAICVVRIGWSGVVRELTRPAYAYFALAEVAIALPYIFALKLLPLQTTQPIIKLNPLFGVLIAVLFLGGKTNWVRSFSIACGVTGVMAIIDPWGGFEMGFLVVLPVVAALVLGTRDAITNKFGTKLDPFVVALAMGIAMLVMSAGFQAIEFDGAWQPIQGSAWIGFAILCTVTPIAYVTRVLAVQKGEMSAIAPMVYSGMIWAMIFGVWIFGDPLTWTQILGASLIAAGGLALIWFDRAKKSPN